MTKIVERKNNIRVAMAKPLISLADIREVIWIMGEKRRTKVFIHLHNWKLLFLKCIHSQY